MPTTKSENAKGLANPATTRRPKTARPAPQPAALIPETATIAPRPTSALPVGPSRPRANRAAESRANLARRASVMLKFVSDPTRLQVILFLAEAEHHVGALCAQLGQSQPAVSHHLALLRHGGIILPRRQGKNNFYSLSGTGSELAKVLKLLLQAA